MPAILAASGESNVPRQFSIGVDAMFGRLKKSLSGPTSPAHSGPAVLTYPVRDYQGDEVVPDGGDWSKYPRDPVVNYEHDTPVGRGAVWMKSANIHGALIPLPLGETQFFQSSADLRGLSLNRYDRAGTVVGQHDPDECLFAAEQAQRLVRDGIVTGVSLEFDPTVKVRIGKSLQAGRPAFRFEKWIGLGYAHTATPVCSVAGLIEANPERQEKALRFLETTSDVSGIIRKSLTAMTRTLRARPTSVRGNWEGDTVGRRFQKADAYGEPEPPDEDDEDPEVDAEPDGDEADTDDADGMEPDATEGDLPPAKPIVAALSNFGQGLLDLIAQFGQDLQASDHLDGIRYAQQVMTDAKQLASEVSAKSETIQQQLTAPPDQEPAELDPNEPAPEPDQDDTGEVIGKSYSTRPRRLNFGNFDGRPTKARETKSAPVKGRALSEREWEEFQDLKRLAAQFD